MVGWLKCYNGPYPTMQPRPRRPRRLRARRRQLTIRQILAWADAHHTRTGRWPKKDDGPVRDAAETWTAIHIALIRGSRGLSGHSSLAQLLTEHRGVPNHLRLPRFRERQVLRWADAFKKRTGRWPTFKDGIIPEAPRTIEAWHHVDVALRMGCRGFPGGSSLARLLARARSVRNRKGLPRLTVPQILAWADAHYARTGEWPTDSSGPIPEAPFADTWAKIAGALSKPLRGIRTRTSLARILEKYRGVRNRKHLALLSVKQILAWVDAFWARTGRRPTEKSGLIADSNGETWGGVNAALRDGYRGFPGGTTLFRLLVKHRRDQR